VPLPRNQGQHGECTKQSKLNRRSAWTGDDLLHGSLSSAGSSDRVVTAPHCRRNVGIRLASDDDVHPERQLGSGDREYAAGLRRCQDSPRTSTTPTIVIHSPYR
jgi:hypothetical protein